MEILASEGRGFFMFWVKIFFDFVRKVLVVFRAPLRVTVNLGFGVFLLDLLGERIDCLSSAWC